MSEMVERVALAISGSDDPVNILAIHRSRARAAIEAMRQPTPEMMAAVDCAGIKETWLSGRAWLAGYQAMIDGALQ